MPELPEVQTTADGIRPFLEGKTIDMLVVRERRLRWMISTDIESLVKGARVTSVTRRAKYIVIKFNTGGLLIHLGMSGSMRVLDEQHTPGRHDHFDLIVDSGHLIRYRDPRKFGCLLYQQGDPESHPRLKNLGIEPLDSKFDGEMLYALSRRRSMAVKQFIMNAKIVVGVGNIYAVESLFDAGIHPARNCSRISRHRYQVLAKSIKRILISAIGQGGTTLQDFVRVDGAPGYFEQSLLVYGRQGKPCIRCGSPLKKTVTVQRSTYYCSHCQT